MRLLEQISLDDPMRLQAILCDIETNIWSLQNMRTWLQFEEYENALYADDYPEFAFIDDDQLIKEMMMELLAALN